MQHYSSAPHSQITVVEKKLQDIKKLPLIAICRGGKRQYNNCRGSNHVPEDCILFLVHCDIRKHNKQRPTLELLILDLQ